MICWGPLDEEDFWKKRIKWWDLFHKEDNYKRRIACRSVLPRKNGYKEIIEFWGSFYEESRQANLDNNIER